MRRAAAALLVLALLASAYGLHSSLWAMRQDEVYPFRSYFLPSSDHMKVLSLGYRSFWADLVYVWSLLYYDYYRPEERWPYLIRSFGVITDLDPRNREAYIMNALFAYLGGRYDLVYTFLDKGIAALPEDTILPFEAGTYALFSEKNMGRAAHYFALASERDPGRALFKKLLAQALASKGETEAARVYWREIYETFKDSTAAEGSYYRGTALRNLWDLKVKEDVLTLDRAVNAYQDRHGAYPRDLAALRRGGFLGSLPLDPAGQPYTYDPQSGMVDCGSRFDFKTAYGGW